MDPNMCELTSGKLQGDCCLTRKHEENTVEILKEYIQHIREENAKMESILKMLDLLHDTTDIKKTVDDLRALQIRNEAKECSVEAVGISVADRQRKQSNYVAKLKICIKIYTNLNEKLAKELKLIKSQLNKSKVQVESFQSFSKEELKCLEAKIKRYDNELLKFEKKYPWLKDPQFNLMSIVKELNTLNYLREEKGILLEELSVYQGLKPDIREATQLLNKVKSEYTKLKNAI